MRGVGAHRAEVNDVHARVALGVQGTLGVADPDLAIGVAHDVLVVPLALHQGVEAVVGGARLAGAPGDVLAGVGVAFVGGPLEALLHPLAVGGVVVEVVSRDHVVGVALGRLLEAGLDAQVLEALRLARLVVQLDHAGLLLEELRLPPVAGLHPRRLRGVLLGAGVRGALERHPVEHRQHRQGQPRRRHRKGQALPMLLPRAGLLARRPLRRVLPVVPLFQNPSPCPSPTAPSTTAPPSPSAMLLLPSGAPSPRLGPRERHGAVHY